ncbi:malonyl-CoA decarboxylase [Lichenihabitans sp. PAMC28606]|uniref:malonyl-CoA decarboxylase n=1 Tax=Lichenihabitans sp. PAMC28606 TaxID=2880932 RepID=UPI001D0AC984|nr:malonyl-CoA decarboxylase [Lichenihabitans sp. PAMC28606]UDL94883.1 malonyl-CoA decarboxylase [Lichenihabitans sp. PAMC28606]
MSDVSTVVSGSGAGMRARSASYVSDLIQSVADRGRLLIGYPRLSGGDHPAVLRLAEALMSVRGEASGVALAQQMLQAYAALPVVERRIVLNDMARRYGPDLTALMAASKAFLATPTLALAATVQKAAEPRALELIRRLNLAPGGTPSLVAMRADLLACLGGDPLLADLDRAFAASFASWFNRGFLEMQRIDWSTSANVLEKIIRYEAVHAISGWDDLRRRLAPQDRRLYAFFHPALIDEPLIFVEVALTTAIPSTIAPLLAGQPSPASDTPANTAVFYSISNAQAGLRGVSFGNFLIKHVVEELKRELPRLQTFVTLSPVPGFAAWLTSVIENDTDGLLSPEDRRVLNFVDRPNWHEKASASEPVHRVLLPLAAHYFLRARTPGGRVIDPVARFHLGNGARLERINPLGDVSRKGMATSHGLMVNYIYNRDEIEANHEIFANKNEVVAASAVRKLLRTRAVPKTVASHA